MPEKNKLDDVEINRLKAIVGMGDKSSSQDDAGKLAEALEKLEGEKKKLEELRKSVVATNAPPKPQREVKESAARIESAAKKEESAEKKVRRDDVKLRESAKKLVEKLKESGKVAERIQTSDAGLRIGGVKKSNKDLFVKIDEHREIAEQLILAKEAIKEIAETVELLAKAESIKEEAIKRLEESLDKIDHAWKRALELLEEGDKTYPEYYDESSTIKGDEYYQLKVELERLRKILEKIK